MKCWLDLVGFVSSAFGTIPCIVCSTTIQQAGTNQGHAKPSLLHQEADTSFSTLFLSQGSPRKLDFRGAPSRRKLGGYFWRYSNVAALTVTALGHHWLWHQCSWQRWDSDVYISVTALSVATTFTVICAHRCHTNVNIAVTALSVDTAVTALSVPPLS